VALAHESLGKPTPSTGVVIFLVHFSSTLLDEIRIGLLKILWEKQHSNGNFSFSKYENPQRSSGWLYHATSLISHEISP
jgi:hypothetical protein